MSVVILRKPEAPSYTIAMGVCEEAILNTIMVMYRIGMHRDVWATCSNICAARGLTEEQARAVVRNAEERAKRRMRA